MPGKPGIPISTNDRTGSSNLIAALNTKVKLASDLSASDPMYLMLILKLVGLIPKHTKFNQISTQNYRTS
jgi:hypothetical protein